MLCCGYILTDFPISIRLTSLALWQSNDCHSASKATLMNMNKYFMWIQYERLHNHNKAKHNKTVCIFLGIYCTCVLVLVLASACVKWSCLISVLSLGYQPIQMQLKFTKDNHLLGKPGMWLYKQYFIYVCSRWRHDAMAAYYFATGFTPGWYCNDSTETFVRNGFYDNSYTVIWIYALVVSCIHIPD